MKKILALLLALVMCFAMVACGADKAPEVENEDVIIEVEGEIVDGEDAIEGEEIIEDGADVENEGEEIAEGEAEAEEIAEEDVEAEAEAEVEA